MSQAYVDIRDRIRRLIHDVDPNRPAIGTLSMNAMIEGKSIEYAGRSFRHDESVQTVTLVAGTYDYTLTGEIFGVQEVLRNSDGYSLTRRTMEYMNEHYRQDTSNPVSRATPTDYGIFELQGTTDASAQRVRIRVGPTPPTGTTETLKVYSQIIPSLQVSYDYYGDDNTSVGSADNIFGVKSDNFIVEAVVHAVAADCVLLLNEEERKRLGISTQIVPVWQKSAENALKAHNWRMRLNSAQSHVEQVIP